MLSTRTDQICNAVKASRPQATYANAQYTVQHPSLLSTQYTNTQFSIRVLVYSHARLLLSHCEKHTSTNTQFSSHACSIVQSFSASRLVTSPLGPRGDHSKGMRALCTSLRLQEWSKDLQARDSQKRSVCMASKRGEKPAIQHLTLLLPHLYKPNSTLICNSEPTQSSSVTHTFVNIGPMACCPPASAVHGCRGSALPSREVGVG